MAAPWVTFRKFNDIGLANEIAAVLEKDNIPFILEDNSRLFEPSFAFSTLNSDISIKLRQPDFSKAGTVLEDCYKDSLGKPAPDYYLFSFTNEELADIVAKPDEWGTYDYLLAQKLLKDRGHEIAPEAAAELREQRIQSLAQPDRVNVTWIIMAYMIALVFSMYGLIAGGVFAWMGKTLPDGRRTWMFHPADRRNGRIIFGIALFMTAVWLYNQGLVMFNFFSRAQTY